MIFIKILYRDPKASEIHRLSTWNRTTFIIWNKNFALGCFFNGLYNIAAMALMKNIYKKYSILPSEFTTITPMTPLWAWILLKVSSTSAYNQDNTQIESTSIDMWFLCNPKQLRIRVCFVMSFINVLIK